MNREHTRGAGPDGLCAARVFYFCYCALGGDRIRAEEAARRALKGADGADRLRAAARALEACAEDGLPEPAATERLLFRVFRLSAPQIARLTGRSAGEVQRALKTQDPGTGVPLLPLLEGECLAECPAPERKN